MELKITTDCSGVDWQKVTDLLKNAGMAYQKAEVHQRAFEASHTTVFVYENPDFSDLEEPYQTESTKGQFMMLQFFLKPKGKESGNS